MAHLFKIKYVSSLSVYNQCIATVVFVYAFCSDMPFISQLTTLNSSGLYIFVNCVLAKKPNCFMWISLS